MSLPIVLVYLGGPLPVYARLNLRYLRRTFPDRDIWLVSDHARSIRAAARWHIKTFECRPADESWTTIRDRIPFRLDFRKGFWFLTFARFYALNEFASAVCPGPFLHVEADVWLSPAFPFEQLQVGADSVAFPLEEFDAGVASTLAIGSESAMAGLVELAERWAADGAELTDMIFLGRLSSEYPQVAQILPSAPNWDEAFRPRSSTQARTAMTNAQGRFDGIFDGMAWGMDLLGEDPRNHWGWLRLFSGHAASALDTTKVKFGVDKSGLPIVISSQGARASLFSMHVHSKDLLMFLAPRWRLLQRVRQRERGRTRAIWLPIAGLRVLWSLGVPWTKRNFTKLVRPR